MPNRFPRGLTALELAVQLGKSCGVEAEEGLLPQACMHEYLEKIIGIYVWNIWTILCILIKLVLIGKISV